MLSERQKTICCMILFKWNVHKRQIYKRQSRSVVASCWGEGEVGSEYLMSTGFFGGWWKCSKITLCAPQICKYTKNHWITHFKWVNLVVCKLHLNKAALKKNLLSLMLDTPDAWYTCVSPVRWGLVIFFFFFASFYIIAMTKQWNNILQ